MLRRYAAGYLGASFLGVALLAGCGSDGTSSSSPAEAPPVESTPSSTTQELAIPEEVIVCQPGMVDTALTVDDVPAWPGPSPSEFEMPTPTPASRGCGTLTGPEAKVVYEAAVNHPAALLEEGRLASGKDLSDTSDALWAVDAVIAWLVVEPQW